MTGAVSKGLRDSLWLAQSSRLPQNTSLFAYLGSSMIYRDGLNGLYMGSVASMPCGVSELGSIVQVGVFGILAGQSSPCNCRCLWLGGRIGRSRLGPKFVVTSKVIIRHLLVVQSGGDL